MFALTATFLPTERDLLNATAVCKQWRTTLLSFPRLWCNVGGSLAKLEAYLERSKSAPIEVRLSSPQLAVSITPHTSRLVALTARVDDSPGFQEIIGHLRDPIPTLRSLEIRMRRYDEYLLGLPSGLDEGLFQHLNTLSLNTIPSFHGPQTFPCITELFLEIHLSHRAAILLLNAFERLPGLVKVSITFHAGWFFKINFPRIVTLPCIQELHLDAFAPGINRPARLQSIPPILQFLRLPKATSITLRSMFPLKTNLSVLPVAPFGKQLPNYVDLPELQIDMAGGFSGTAVFRSSSNAVLTYHTGPLENYRRDRLLWGGLLLSSVRRVTAVLEDPELEEAAWLSDMLGDLDFLELLDLGGDCSWVLQRLRRRLKRGATRIDIKKLIVRGGERAKTQAVKFESAKDGLGLKDMTVTYIPGPKKPAQDDTSGDDDTSDSDVTSDDEPSDDGD